MKKAIFGAILVISALSSKAAIQFNYNNTTGQFNLSGSDNGPGVDVGGGTILYFWDWGTTGRTNNVHNMINILSSDHINGTAAGKAIISSSAFFIGEFGTGFEIQTGSGNDTGALSLNTASGILSAGLWNQGEGVFSGTSSSSTTENFTITVTNVPEPGAYGLIVSLGALGSIVILHRRKQ